MLTFQMNTDSMSLKDAIVDGRLNMNDIQILITQILNVTAYLHSQGVFLEYLDLETVFIKRNLI